MDAPSGTDPTIPGFTIEAEIGRGATSRVYRARQDALDRTVALKVITTLGERGRRRALRLFSEARLSGALDHPGVVRGIDAGTAHGLCWFAMEYVAGSTLQERLEPGAGPLPLPAPEVTRMGIQLLGALRHTHARDVIHRDIKPANVLLGDDGRARLLDLGLARRVADPRITQEGGTVGTPQYMAPEQARHPDRVDARADLFSLSATLYHALCGVAPFSGQTIGEVVTRLLYEDPEPPSRHLPGLPPAWDLVFARALAKQPADRYQSAAEMAADLQALARGLPPAASPAARWRPRHSIRAAAVVLVLALGGLGAWLALRSGSGAGSGERHDGVPAKPIAEEVPPELRQLRELEGLRKAEETPAVRAARVTRARALLEVLSPPHAESGRAVLSQLEAAFFEAVDLTLESRRKEGLEAFEQGRLFETAFDAFLAPDPAALVEPGTLPPDLEPQLGLRLAAEGAARAAAVEERRTRVRERLDAELAFLDRDLREARIGIDALNERTRKGLERCGFNLLTAAEQRQYEQRRKELVRDLAGRPRRRYEEAMRAVRDALKDRRYSSARSALARALLERESVAGLGEEVARLEGVIASAIAEEVATLGSLRRLVRRPDSGALDAAAIRQRLADLQRALEEAPDPAELPGLGVVLEELRRSSALLAAAAGLRARALETSVDRASREPPLVLAPILDEETGPVSPRVLRGVEGDRIIWQRQSDGFEQQVPIGDHSLTTVARLAAGSGEEPPWLAAALLAHLEGHDLLADELLRRAPASPLEEQVREIVGEALDRWIAGGATESERQAAEALVALRRAVWSGDVAAQEQALRTLSLPALRKSQVYAENRAGIVRLREGLELRRRAEGTRERHHLDRYDPETGQAEIRIPQPGATEHLLVSVDAAHRSDESGIHLLMGDADAATPPHALPGLRIALPGEALQVEVRFQIAFETGSGPPACLGFELFDANFLALGRIADAAPFRGEPLHGLERDLYTVRPKERAVFWLGSPGKHASSMRALGAPCRLPAGRRLAVTLTLGRAAGAGSVAMDDFHFPLGPRDRPRFVGEGLVIRGWPAFVISDIVVDLELPGEGRR